MAGDAFLVDTNILIRSVQPHDSDYPVVDACLARLVQSSAKLYYTSQNLGEFWNSLTRPADRNGYGLSPSEANDLAKMIKRNLGCSPTASWCMRNGEGCW